jgi:hypothetical protein
MTAVAVVESKLTLAPGIDDHKPAELALTLREVARWCVIEEQGNQRDPKLSCSMGLA